MNSDVSETVRSFRTIWRDYRTTATLHGVLHMTAQRSQASCVFWAVLTATICMTFLLVTTLLFLNYSDLKTVTVVSVKQKGKLQFPSVTVCPTSMYNFAKIRNNSALLRYLSYVSKISAIFPGGELNFSDPENHFLLENGKDNWLTTVGFGLDETLLSCSFSGQVVKCSNLLVTKMTDMGLCFMINDEGLPLTSTYPGKSAGLSVLVYIDQDNFMPTENMAIGMSVAIHDKGEEPNMEGDSFLVSSGTVTDVAIGYKQDILLPAPYSTFADGQCVEIDGESFVSPLQHHVTYSHHACVRECKSRYVFRKCGCRKHTYPGLEKPCSFYQIHTCADVHEDEFNRISSHTEACDCPRPCTRTYYDKQISSAKFLSDVTALELGSQGYNISRKNMAQVLIYYRSLTRERRKQVPKMDALTLLGNLGGYMGIFLGASILSLFELFQAVLQTIKHFVTKARRKNTSVTRVDDIYMVME